MLTASRIVASLAIVLGSFSPVLASSGARADHSGIVVWAFLGFCGLIVVAQLIPAFLMMFGMARGVVESSRTPVAEKAN